MNNKNDLIFEQYSPLNSFKNLKIHQKLNIKVIYSITKKLNGMNGNIPFNKTDFNNNKKNSLIERRNSENFHHLRSNTLLPSHLSDIEEYSLPKTIPPQFPPTNFQYLSGNPTGTSNSLLFEHKIRQLIMERINIP